MGPRFESVKVHHGPLVKWLRQRPLTPLTSVRIRYGSPDFSRAKVLDKGSEIQYNTVCSPARPDDIELVLIRARVHPFPSRTRKLSSLLLTILGWRRPGKIGNANTTKRSGQTRPDRFQYSSLAQSVEHAAVNRGVVGSSPTGGARVGRHLYGGGPFSFPG